MGATDGSDACTLDASDTFHGPEHNTLVDPDSDS